MNLLLLDAGEVGPGGEVELVGRRADHINTVIRAGAGDRLRAGLVRGALGTAEVLAAAPGQVRLRFAADPDAPPAAPPPVDLIVAVPRPKAMARLLQTAASLGVGRIDLVNAWRVDKSYLAADRLAPDRLAAELRLGCEQGVTTWVPDIAVHRLFVPYVDALAAAPATGRRLLAQPRAGRRLEQVFAPGCGDRVVLAIGPEGGWIDRERDSFAAAGFDEVTISERVLRSEIAVAAALAQLELLRRYTI